MMLKNEKVKLNEKIYNMKQKVIFMIFSNMIQLDLLLIIFILAKLVQMKLK